MFLSFSVNTCFQFTKSDNSFCFWNNNKNMKDIAEDIFLLSQVIVTLDSSTEGLFLLEFMILLLLFSR